MIAKFRMFGKFGFHSNVWEDCEVWEVSNVWEDSNVFLLSDVLEGFASSEKFNFSYILSGLVMNNGKFGIFQIW